jgi:D-3-phosphoglycerate dehydrogenase / 2-oxoglutarate reductase
MKIAVADDYQGLFTQAPNHALLAGHAVTVFTEPANSNAMHAARLRDAQIVVLTQQRTRFPRELIDQLPQLAFISQTGRNTGHVDIAACSERGIVVSAIGGGYPHATVELTWGLIIGALRHIPFEAARLRAGHWQSTTGTCLHGLTLGIYAYGRIGKLVADVGRAFGMKILCWGRAGSTARAREDGHAVASSRAAFFAAADVLSLHLPLRDETRGGISAADLACMKPSALLVNTSRAGILAPGALAAALQKGRPGYAAVDVFDDEPVLGATDPLLALPNALCTPHLGYVTRETLLHHYKDAIDQITAFCAGKPINLVNPDALARNACLRSTNIT